MDDRLNSLYALPDLQEEEDIYLLDLSEQCTHLEKQLRNWMASLPQAQRLLLENYIDARDELEFQSVKRALHFKK